MISVSWFSTNRAVRIRLQEIIVSSLLLRDLVRGFSNNILYCGQFVIPHGHINIITLNNELFFVLWRCDPTRVMASSFLRFLDHTQRRTTVGRTTLDEWSARRRDLYLRTHYTHNRQASMSPVGFELTISAGKRTQTYTLDRAAAGTGK
jgi:hypothetical protein